MKTKQRVKWIYRSCKAPCWVTVKTPNFIDKSSLCCEIWPQYRNVYRRLSLFVESPSYDIYCPCMRKSTVHECLMHLVKSLTVRRLGSLSKPLFASSALTELTKISHGTLHQFIWYERYFPYQIPSWYSTSHRCKSVHNWHKKLVTSECNSCILPFVMFDAE